VQDLPPLDSSWEASIEGRAEYHKYVILIVCGCGHSLLIDGRLTTAR
jgi:hypothetical protein